MSNIKALDKLVEFVSENTLLVEMVEAVEYEVAEQFIELPCDAEGVPIRPGDLLEYDYGGFRGRHTVVALIYDGNRTEDDGGIWDFEFDDDDCEDTRCVGSMRDFYSCNRHVKPRTLEDVLASYRFDARNIYEDPMLNGNQRVDELEALDSKVADEIRELMGVSE